MDHGVAGAGSGVTVVNKNPMASTGQNDADRNAFSHPQILIGSDFDPQSQPGDRLDLLFEQLADKYTTSAAVISDGRAWSYRDLDEKSNQLARILIERGVQPGDRIGLLLDRSAITYITLLAVMKAGAAYVPLASAYPKDRMMLILEDASVKLIITLKSYEERAAEMPVPHILVDTAMQEIDAQSKARLDRSHRQHSAEDLCYILYTSGTTGRPKGVAIRQQSITNFVRVAALSYGYRPEDRVYHGMTIAFDFSAEEYWVPFVAGATVVPAPGPQTWVGEELADFLRSHNITCMACSPTLLSSIESDVPTLRLLMVGGEACPLNLVQRWSRPDRLLLNTYGPTEATVTATMGVLTPDKPVTIGAPLPTYSIVIIDANEAKLTDPDELGEIGIAGIGLAVGYLNRPDLTEAKFIPDFIGLPSNPSQRIYRTGDMGRINAEGEIEYRGRIDTQVKIRGFRIELGEIEAVLLDQPAIAQAAVTTWEIEPGRVELVAYYAPKQGMVISRGDIARELKRRLPDYMVPSYVEELEAIPMTVANKTDTRRLPKPTSLRIGANREIVLPSNEVEEILAETLAEVLSFDQVSVTDNFFDDLGANSLLMARFCARVRKRPEWATTSMREVYQHPTVALLAEYLGTPEQTVDAVDEPVLTHRASSFAYWLTGFFQLSFYAAYSFVTLWAFNKGLNWVYDKLDEPFHLYLRCVLLSAAVFFGMTGFSVLAKWALIGKWKPEAFKIWGLKYYRFWVVQTLIRTAPVVLFRGSPLYSLYLQLLGAKLGRSTVIECRAVPVCTDLISIGENTILRKESLVLGYRAQAGYIHTGPIEIGDHSFVGVGSLMDINTKIGNYAQLGHASSLQRGQSIPDGENWHGSPAIPTTADYCKIRNVNPSNVRRVLYEAAQLISLFLIVTPIPLLFHSYWQNVGDDYQETIGVVAIGTTVTLFGFIVIALLGAMVIPRIINLLFLRTGKTYTMYGFRYWLQMSVEICSNIRPLNLLFGDSSAITHYMQAIGWNLNKVVQTGSNFGSNQQHENPQLCEIGTQTMVSDGLFMINMHKSATAFRLERTKVGERNYFGNNIYYPPDACTGDNVLLGTKVMVPIDGPIRENVGLLGSPSFEIPRMVNRDKELLNNVSEEDRKSRLKFKNRYNAVTALLFILAQWLMLFVTLAIWDRALNYYTEWAATALFVAVFLTSAIAIPFYVLLERASLGFGTLKPLMTTIYDVAFWHHERHWKLSDSPITRLFPGTPFRPMILRMLGVKVGKRVFDGGANLTERSLVEIGDDATLNEGCVIQAHSLEEGAFKSDYIRIGDGCTLAPAAFVHYGVTMESGSVADVDSFVMKGEVLEANSIWRGNPAKLHGFIKPIKED